MQGHHQRKAKRLRMMDVDPVQLVYEGAGVDGGTELSVTPIHLIAQVSKSLHTRESQNCPCYNQIHWLSDISTLECCTGLSASGRICPHADTVASLQQNPFFLVLRILT